MISSSTVLSRRKRSVDNQQQHSSITASDAQLYRDLAQASGGLAIEVTKSELPQAVSIITESSSSSLVISQTPHYYLVLSIQTFQLCHLFHVISQVTLLQAARSPGKADNFTFLVDETVINLTVYITGHSVTFTLVSPTGNTAFLNEIFSVYEH